MTRSTAIAGSIIITAFVMLFAAFGPHRHPELWFTPDQRGDRLIEAQNYTAAAKAYADPFRQGTALFRAGDFKAAAAAFGRAGTPQAAYNRGNCFVMLGKYDDAVKAYDRALTLQPDLTIARDNREIAIVRRDRLRTTGGDEIGGEVKPDEVVYEKGPHKDGDAIQVDGGAPLNDEQLRSLWLRRVQTKPADFLRAKFAYQAQDEAEGAP